MQKNEVVENVVEIAGKTALSVIPVGGTLISCVWDAVKGNAAQKRLDDWKEKVEERLSKVELSIDEIGSNEIFTSTIMRATDIANYPCNIHIVITDIQAFLQADILPVRQMCIQN